MTEEGIHKVKSGRGKMKYGDEQAEQKSKEMQKERVDTRRGERRRFMYNTAEIFVILRRPCLEYYSMSEYMLGVSKMIQNLNHLHRFVSDPTMG